MQKIFFYLLIFISVTSFGQDKNFLTDKGTIIVMKAYDSSAVKGLINTNTTNIGTNTTNIGTNTTNISALTKKDNLIIYFGGQSNEGTDPNTGTVPYDSMPSYLKQTYSNVWLYVAVNASASLQFQKYSPTSANTMGWLDQTLYILGKAYKNVYLIKRSLGGTHLYPDAAAGFYPRSDYRNIIGQGKVNIYNYVGQSNSDIINLWGQCESDGISTLYANNYKSSLKNWIDSIRSEVSDNIWFIKGISNRSKDFTYRANVRAGQDSVAQITTQRVHLISSNDLQMKGDNTKTGEVGAGDFSHYNSTTAIALGSKFADTILTVLTRKRDDYIAPQLLSCSTNVAGTTLTLKYNESLAGARPWWQQFIVGTKVWSSIVVDADSVVLTPTVPFYSGITYTFSYTKNIVYKANLQDLQGNETPDVTSFAITNTANTPQPAVTTLYTSNFSAGLASAGDLENFWTGTQGATATAPVTSPSGVVNSVQLLCAGVANNNRFYKWQTTGLTANKTYRITFKIEVPDVYSFPANPSSYYAKIGTLNTVSLDISKLVVRDNMTYLEYQFFNTLALNDDIYFEVSSSIASQLVYFSDVRIYQVGP